MKKPLGILALCFLVSVLVMAQEQQGTEKNAIYHASRGDNLAARGEYRKAVHAYRTSLAKNPSYARAITGLAATYYHLQVYGKSLELYQRAQELEGKTSLVLAGQAQAHSALGNYTTALKLLTVASRENPDDLDNRYYLARLYYDMGRKIWAQRQLDSLLRLNPFHYQGLLLQARLKSDQGRYSDARIIVNRAIDNQPQEFRGYVILAEIFYRDYFLKSDTDSLAEAEHTLQNALAIRPTDMRANRLKGVMLYDRGLYSDALPFFKKAMEQGETPGLGYNVAMSLERTGAMSQAFDQFLEVLKQYPNDTVSRSALEDHMLFTEVRAGNPARVLLSREHRKLADQKEREHLADGAVMYLRRSLMLNPLHARTRERLMEYFNVQGYNRLYLDELKELMRLYPEKSYQDQLKIEVIKRRKLLYYREGYFPKMPPRDVPRVLVFDLQREDPVPVYLDLGKVLSGYLTFTLGQFGRMQVAGLRVREKISRELEKVPGGRSNRLEALEDILKKTGYEKPDFIIMGKASTNGTRISATYELYDYKRSLTIDSFTLQELQREAVPHLSLRAATRIYKTIPFSGRVLKLDENGLVTNLGTRDGITKDTPLVIRKKISRRGEDTEYRTVLFNVVEADTYISRAEPANGNDLELIDNQDRVMPLKRRRARLIRE